MVIKQLAEFAQVYDIKSTFVILIVYLCILEFIHYTVSQNPYILCMVFKTTLLDTTANILIKELMEVCATVCGKTFSFWLLWDWVVSQKFSV